MALLMLPLTLGADVDTPHYRVEVIVFVNADGRSDARTVQNLEDFSALTDPLARARQAAAAPHPAGSTEEDRHREIGTEDDATTDQTRQAELDAVLELIDTLTGLEEGTLMPQLPVWPEPYLALDHLSPRMERALARLNDSPGHEVLSWQAWHQPLSTGSPGERVRIHDNHPVAIDWLELPPAGVPAPIADGDGDFEAIKPNFHYRLDGGIRLRQRQFMHLEGNLHWRVERAPSPWMTSPEFRDEPAGGYQLHRLNQSRTVRPGRLEYFDSSWLGMLVLIEPIAPLDGSDAEHDDLLPAMD